MSRYTSRVGGTLYSGTAFDDFSATISSTTSSIVVPENFARSGILINTINAADVWINFGAPAVKGLPSIRIQGNSLFTYTLASYGCIDTRAIHMIRDGSGTGPVVIKENMN